MFEDVGNMPKEYLLSMPKRNCLGGMKSSYLSKFGVKAAHFNAELSDFDESIAKAGKEVVRTGGSAFIFGPCGVGKTHFMVAMMKHFMRNTNYHTHLFTLPKFLQFLRFELIQNNKPELEIVETFEKNGLALFLDDLGADNKCGDWAGQILLQILDSRFSDFIPTIISSNLTPDEVGVNYGERLGSRIHKDTIFFEMNGPDKRKE